MKFASKQMNGLEKSSNNGRSARGTFMKGNRYGVGNGRPRGAKDQLNKLRDVVCDALFEQNEEGELRLERAIKQSKPEHLLALAGKLIPKSVDMSLQTEIAVVPIVLDAQPFQNDVKLIES